MKGSRALLILIKRFSRAHPWRLTLGIVLTGLAVAMGAGLLAASGFLITGSALAGLGLMLFETFVPSAIVRFLALGRTAARYFERLATHDATLRFLTALRVTVFETMLAAPEPRPRAGMLFNRLTGDLDALDGILIRLVIPLVASILVLTGTALVLATIDPILALAATLPLLAGGVFAPLLLARGANRHARLKLHALDAARIRAIDLDRGRAELAARGDLARQSARIEAALRRAAHAEKALVRRETLIRFLSGLGAHGALLGTLLTLPPLLEQNRLSLLAAVALALFSMALGEIIAPLRLILLDYGRWRVAARRIAAFDAQGPSLPAAPAVPMAGAADIRFEGVSVLTQGASAPRLGPLTLVLRKGARIALIGPSGSGKSTLLGLLSGTIVPSSGHIVFAGQGWPRVIALGQRTELFRGTVAENLRLARPGADDAALRGVLAAVELDQALGADGLQRFLGDGGSGLSGGERRRLALARMMLQTGDLILLDEPTEGLDAAMAERIFAALLEWAGPRTFLYATHRPFEMECADERIQLSQGCLVR